MSDKKAKKKEAAGPEAKAEGEGDAPSKKKPPILVAGLGAALFLGSGAGVFFLLPSQGGDDGAETGSGAHGETEAHGGQAEPNGSGHGDIQEHKEKRARGDGGHGEADAAAPPILGQFAVAGDTGFYLPDPFIVSLDPKAGVKHLKIVLAIEAPPETASLYEAQSLRLRDAMTTYLRAVDIAALGDPAAMASIREQLRRRVEFVVSPENVKDVLILDFILT